MANDCFVGWDTARMSWDIFVQRLPEGVISVGEIPSDFSPGPLGDRGEIVAAIERLFPDIDFTDPEWGIIERDGYSIEVNISSRDPVQSFALHVRGDAKAAPAVTSLLDELGFRALDPQSPTGIFEADGAAGSMQTWDEYRRNAVE